MVPAAGQGGVFCHSCNMGGKNKKHKTPGAAAVRAAVSASRAKSTEAGATGEAQNKKPVSRPAPAAAASTREPRVKQGMNGQAPDSSGASTTRPEGEAFARGQTLDLKICFTPRAAVYPSGSLVLD